jgi:hypothetical protein
LIEEAKKNKKVGAAGVRSQTPSKCRLFVWAGKYLSGNCLRRNAIAGNAISECAMLLNEIDPIQVKK